MSLFWITADIPNTPPNDNIATIDVATCIWGWGRIRVGISRVCHKRERHGKDKYTYKKYCRYSGKSFCHKISSLKLIVSNTKNTDKEPSYFFNNYSDINS
jgi:hypothetical protein